MCVGENPVKMRRERMCEQGAVYWGRSGTDSRKTMYRPENPTRDILLRKKCPALSLPSTLPQPPAAPSHSSYEPRAGRSEYNFLYCVNVRTYV